jgi:CheY-specific phosphatase CheX
MDSMTRPERVADAFASMTIRAVSAVFASYGLRLTDAQRAAPGAQGIMAFIKQAGFEPPTVGATINFFGPQIHGELLLASTFDLIARTRPAVGQGALVPESGASQMAVRDWMGELANQVLGQFKNQLRGHSLSFETRTPVPLSGQALAMAVPKSAATRPVLFRAGGGALSFWFDVFCNAELDLNIAVGEESKEDLVLF